MDDVERAQRLDRMRVDGLLYSATKAREGRDRWRTVGPILRQLRAAGVTFQQIRDETGISRATAHRLIASSRLSATTPST